MKQQPTEPPADACRSPHDIDLRKHVIYRCLVGSQAYGLADDHSDHDRRGIYLPPASLHWSLRGVPERIDLPEQEAFYWELETFLKLALKANPTTLEVLYSPCVEYVSPLAEPLLGMRDKFLSKLLHQTISNYAQSQFQKIERDLRQTGKIKWKHAMHLIRLQLLGIDAMQTGSLHLVVSDPEHKQKLLDIRQGIMSWPVIHAWQKTLHVEFEQALAATPLPDQPDYATVNDYLISARLAMVHQT